MNHSILAPSSADRWSRCTGSVQLEQQFPELERSPEAIEGDQADAVVQALLLGQPLPEYANDEMMEGASLMLQTVAPLYEAALELRIQDQIEIRPVHEQCFGTPDVYAIDEKQQIVHVIDYKFGHRYVPPTSRQLVAYAAGAISFKLWSQGYQAKLTIVQPRNFHSSGPVRSVTLSGEQMKTEISILNDAAYRALNEPTTVPGAHCIDCKARHACPALAEAAYVAIQVASNMTPQNMDHRAKGRELATLRRAQELLKARTSGLEEELTFDLKHGAAVPGWALEQSMGRMKWRVPPEQVLSLGQLFGAELAGIGWIKTPVQAKKLGVPETVLPEYTEQLPGEIKLVEDDGSKAKMVFSKEKA